MNIKCLKCRNNRNKMISGSFFAVWTLVLTLLLTGCGAGQVEPDTAVEEETEAVMTVSIGGKTYLPDTVSITLDNSTYSFDELLEAASKLTSLKKLNLGCTTLSAEDISRLRETAPDVELKYSVEFDGKEYSCDTENLDFSCLTQDKISEAAAFISRLPDLTTVKITSDDGDNLLNLADLKLLQEAAPQAAFDYRFEMYGKMISTADTELEYVQVKMGNEAAEAWKQVLPYMTKLERLCLDDCGIDNEVMADLRDSFPEKSIVWRVFWNSCSSLTDTRSIRMTTNAVSNNGVKDTLKYCTEVRYLDFGHNAQLSDIDYLAYMPHLKLCILSDMPITDLTPISNCKELVMLEIVNCYLITDISPLAECTNLKLLNFSNTRKITDITPLYGLTNLERLFASDVYAPVEQQEEIREKLPDCWITFGHPEKSLVSYNYSIGWRLDAAPNVRAEWYLELRKIFGIGYPYYSSPEGWFSCCREPYTFNEDELVYFAD